MNYSRQREALLKLMKSGKLDHPTADAVYVEIRKEYPNISLGTVYRNLNLLAEHNELLKIVSPCDADRFDHNVHAHYHVVCKQCGRTKDIEAECLNLEINKIQKRTGFLLDDSDITLIGTCLDCQNKAYKK